MERCCSVNIRSGIACCISSVKFSPACSGPGSTSTKNIEAGYLETEDDLLDENSSVKLTPFGKKEAGNIFRNAFEGMQKGGHGECGPDCEFCYSEGEKLEDCVHNCADSRHTH